MAVKQVAGKVARAGLEGLFGVAEQQGGGSGDTQKKLDVLAVRARKRRVTPATGACCLSAGVAHSTTQDTVQSPYQQHNLHITAVAKAAFAV